MVTSFSKINKHKLRTCLIRNTKLDEKGFCLYTNTNSVNIIWVINVLKQRIILNAKHVSQSPLSKIPKYVNKSSQ